MASIYLDHFGLTGAAFTIAPDPRYLYLSQHHREALAHLLYGVAHSDGFVVLTGEVGAGKTTVCRCLLEQMPAQCDVALVFNPKLSVVELLATICEEFHVELPAGNTSIKIFVDRLNAYLLAAHARGRTPVLIIDEAQSLAPAVLEQIRLLTNLETNARKLLRIVLLGQPQLRDVLARPELLQLRQRILARYHLAPLSRDETAAYVAHRLQVAGCRRPLFTGLALRRLYRLSGGVPRLINVLADRALLGAYVRGESVVNRATMSRAGREVFGQRSAGGWQRFALAGSAGAAAVAALLFLPASFSGNALRALVAAAAGLQAEAAAAAPAVAVAAEAPVAAAAAKAAMPAAAAADASAAAAPSPAVETEAVPAGAGAAATSALPALDAAGKEAVPAYEAMFRKWGLLVSPADAADACRRAEAFGLRCVSERGDLADLRRIDRPAVLRMRAGGADVAGVAGEDYLAVLAWHGDEAVVADAGGERQLPVAALAERWAGDYVVLWRLPAHFRDVMRPGSQGPAVEHLAAQLAQLRGQPYAGGKLVFDEGLLREVRDFQLAAGLLADGLAGPQTLLRLDQAVADLAPTLSEKGNWKGSGKEKGQ